MARIRLIEKKIAMGPVCAVKRLIEDMPAGYGDRLCREAKPALRRLKIRVRVAGERRPKFVPPPPAPSPKLAAAWDDAFAELMPDSAFPGAHAAPAHAMAKKRSRGEDVGVKSESNTRATSSMTFAVYLPSETSSDVAVDDSSCTPALLAKRSRFDSSVRSADGPDAQTVSISRASSSLAPPGALLSALSSDMAVVDSSYTPVQRAKRSRSDVSVSSPEEPSLTFPRLPSCVRTASF